MFRSLVCLFLASSVAAADRPNIILVVTDDQGYGDLGCHGNPVVKTPNIDRFAAQSVECTHFYVCPVCSPTRASLLTGRYNFRTGVVDTFHGRSLMRPDETTAASLLASAGYRTAMFGKWHLGDNYPLRPQDRSFDEVLMLRGGGIGQPSDPPGSSYHNPILEHNGKLETYDRYCSDLFTDEAIRFIEQPRSKPFFVYLPFNCPHTPLQAPEKETAIYGGRDLAPAAFPKIGQPPEKPILSQANLAKFYGMVTNIDTNFGRLLAKLDELKLADNTIVIFLSDNGPQEWKFNAGLRGLKGSVYEGGIRVPFFVRWPAGGIGGGRKIDSACAHIDLLPSLTAACDIKVPSDRTIDGVNLLPLWKGEKSELPERTLFFQWHRGDAPEKYRACTVRGPRFKLVQSSGVQPGTKVDAKFELFDISADPYEQNDVAAQHPEVVAKLKAEYEPWFEDVTKAGFAPVRPILGTLHENPTRLTWQDWHMPSGNDATTIGYWEVTLPRDGKFDVTLRFAAAQDGSTAHFRLGASSVEERLTTGATTHTFRGVKLPAGEARLEGWVERNGAKVGVLDVEVKRLE